MNGSTLQRIAMEAAEQLPAVTCTFPFGPEHDVFKVGGRVFLLATSLPGRQIVTMKCEPPYSVVLRQEFATITPGYHMNKKHWISIAAGPGITGDLVEELVLNAYLLVAESLPKARQPLGLEGCRRAAEALVAQDQAHDAD